MAATRRTGVQTQQRRMQGQQNITYIDGNAVRHIQTMPNRQPQRRQRTAAQTNINTLRNREKALHITMSYVVFLTAAAVMTVILCVNYLQLQAQGTSYRKQIASLESTLSTAKTANDTAYEETISSVNMDEVKDIAVNELGMEYANKGQVVFYSSQEGDYIKQYAEVPAQ